MASISKDHADLLKIFQATDTLAPTPIPYRVGRPCASRLGLLRAFVIKNYFEFPTTKGLREELLLNAKLRRLCSWDKTKDIPSETTFSRAFGEFERTGILRKCLQVMKRRIDA